jgi:hypothetical protein
VKENISIEQRRRMLAVSKEALAFAQPTLNNVVPENPLVRCAKIQLS